MTVTDDIFEKTFGEWLQQALARDAERWAELEQELKRLREKAQPPAADQGPAGGSR